MELSYGERSGVYTGTLIEGFPDGKGSFTTTNDKGHEWTYVGEWIAGHMNGEGVCTWPDQTFEGTYVDDYEIYGTYTFLNDNEKYVGECDKGDIKGEGTYYFSDGGVFTGTFKGRYDAEGTYEINGEKYNAKLIDGVVSKQE